MGFSLTYALHTAYIGEYLHFRYLKCLVMNSLANHLSNEKNSLVVLGYIGDDYTTQLCEDYNKPVQGSLIKTTSIMESKRVFVVPHFSLIKYDQIHPDDT